MIRECAEEACPWAGGYLKKILSELRPRGWVVVSQAKKEGGRSPCPWLASLPVPAADVVPLLALGTSGCWLHTDLAQCPAVLTAPWPRLGHLLLSLSVSDLGRGHSPPHFFYIGADSSQDPRPPGEQDRWGHHFPLSLLESTSFQTVILCSRDNNSGSMQVLCLWCGQWLRRKPFLTQLYRLDTEHPTRSQWCGEQEGHACWVKPRCILLVPAFGLAAAGLTVPTCFSPGYTSSCWIPLSLWINSVVLLTGLQLLFPESHRHILGFLWTGAAESTHDSFIY